MLLDLPILEKGSFYFIKDGNTHFILEDKINSFLKELITPMHIFTVTAELRLDEIRSSLQVIAGHYQFSGAIEWLAQEGLVIIVSRSNVYNVQKLKAKILQIKEIGANEYIGYNQTYKTKKTIKTAILGIGYGDGIFRILSNKGKVYFKKKSFRIVGRISMDSMTINITNCKHKICVGEYMEIINDDNDIEKIAKEYSTISREILTSISRRVIRQYI